MKNFKVKTMFMAGAMMLLATGCGKAGSNTNQGNKTNDVFVPDGTGLVASVEGVKFNILDGLDKIMGRLSINGLYVCDPKNYVYYDGEEYKREDLNKQAVKYGDSYWDEEQGVFIEGKVQILDEAKYNFIQEKKNSGVKYFSERDLLSSKNEGAEYTLDGYDLYSFTVNNEYKMEKRLEYEILEGKTDASDLGEGWYSIPGYGCVNTVYQYSYMTETNEMDKWEGYIIVYVDGKPVDFSAYYEKYEELLRDYKSDTKWLSEPIAAITSDDVYCNFFDNRLETSKADFEDKEQKIKDRFCAQLAFSDAMGMITSGEAKNVVMIEHYCNFVEDYEYILQNYEPFTKYTVFKKN